MHHSIYCTILHECVSLLAHRVTKISAHALNPSKLNGKKFDLSRIRTCNRVNYQSFSFDNVLNSCTEHEDQRKYYEIHSMHSLFINWNSFESQWYWCQRAWIVVDAFPKEQTRALPIWATRSLIHFDLDLICSDLRFRKNILFKTASNGSWLSWSLLTQLCTSTIQVAVYRVWVSNILRLALNHGTHKESIFGIASFELDLIDDW